MINKYTLILLAVCVMLSVGWLRSCNKEEAKDAIITGLNKNLRIERDENGRNKTTINLLRASRKDLLSLKPDRDTALAILQSVVKADKNIVAATVFKTITTSAQPIAAKADPVLSVVPETTRPEDRKNLKIIGKVKSNGFEGTIEATADSVKLTDFKVFNRYTITQTSESQGLFKPRLQIVNIIPEDPNSTVVDARSFTINPGKQRTGLKIGIGVGIGLAAYHGARKVFK